MGYVINLKADTGLVDRSENTTRFYRDINKYPTLTRDEETVWFNRLKHGTEKEKAEAREYILMCNQRLVVAAAKKYAQKDTLMDYVNEANFGLIEAIDKFDVSMGVKFASYATWFIKRSINSYNNGASQMVKRTNSSKTFHVISKATNEFIQEYERNPTSDELLDVIKTKYNKDDIKDKTDLLDVRISYIDDSASEDDEANYGDVAAYNKASASINGYEVTEVNDFNNNVIETLLNKLTPRKREIIKMRFGLYDEGGLRREYERDEIGERLGLTSERVRQLESEAMEEMKEMCKEASFSR